MEAKTRGCPYNNLFIYHVDGIFDYEYEKNLEGNYLGNWVEDKYSFLFFSEDPGDDVEKIIKQQSHLRLIDKYSFSYEEWQGGGFEKNHVDDFLIIPPWEGDTCERAEHKIILDPGVVFGNGLHPTTKDCLRALSYLKKQYSFKKVLDIGTGTGILAIASVLLGANFVSAVDLNPLAVKTAANNIKLNGYKSKVKVYEGKAEDFFDSHADLVIANIHFDVIKSLISKPGFLGREYLIFSGLMRSQAREVKSMLLNRDLYIENEWDHEMTWYTILARDKNER